LSDFNETWIFEKCSNTSFYVNMSRWNRAVLCGRTDRHDEANSRLLAIFANAPKETKYADNHPRHEQNPKAVSQCPSAGGEYTSHSLLEGWLYCHRCTRPTAPDCTCYYAV